MVFFASERRRRRRRRRDAVDANAVAAADGVGYKGACIILTHLFYILTLSICIPIII